MKKLFPFLMVAALAIFVAAPLALACEGRPQCDGHGPDGQGYHGDAHGAMFGGDGDFEARLKDMDPEMREKHIAKKKAMKDEIMKRRFAHLEEKLGLTGEQATAVQVFEIAQHEREKAFHESMRPLREDMKALLQDENASDRDFENLLDKMKDLKNRKMRDTERAHQDIQNILSPRQQAQYIVFQKHFEKRMKKFKSQHGRERGHGRPEGHPPVDGKWEGKKACPHSEAK